MTVEFRYRLIIGYLYLIKHEYLIKKVIIILLSIKKIDLQVKSKKGMKGAEENKPNWTGTLKLRGSNQSPQPQVLFRDIFL